MRFKSRQSSVARFVQKTGLRNSRISFPPSRPYVEHIIARAQLNRFLRQARKTTIDAKKATCRGKTEPLEKGQTFTKRITEFSSGKLPDSATGYQEQPSRASITNYRVDPRVTGGRFNETYSADYKIRTTKLLGKSDQI